MKKLLAFIILGLVVLSINPQVINATEVFLQGTDMIDEMDKATKGVILYNVKDQAATKIILSKEVALLFHDDYYETDPGICYKYKSILWGCPNLEEISVQSENQSFTSIQGSVYSKNGKALYAVPVKKAGILKIEEGTQAIGKCAVNGCDKLTSIIIPSTLRRVCEAGLSNNKGVSQYKINGKSAYFTVKDGVLYTKDMKTLVSYPAGKTKRAFKIPEGVKTIQSAAFSGNSYLKEIKLSNSVQVIENETFRNCTALSKFTSSKKLRHIYAGAFYDCKKLKTVTLKEGLISLREDCFTGTTSLKKIYLPETLSNTYGLSSLHKPITVTAYRHSTAWNLLNNQKKVKMITKTHAKKAKKTITVKKTLKSKGHPSTKWYKKGKKAYAIKSADELAGLAKLVNTGNDFAGCTITLSKNLDLKTYKNFPQIGGYHKVKGKNKECKFSGTFDGKMHSVCNLTMVKDSVYGGLFYKITKQSSLKNVIIKGVDIDATAFTGALVGGSKGSIEHCKVYGTVKGTQCVGAVVGICDYFTVLNDCSSHATVTGVSTVGGVVGEIWSDVKNCRNHESVTGVKEVGGIAGKCAKSLIECKNDGKVSGYEAVGPIKGAHLFGTTRDCINTGKVVNR